MAQEVEQSPATHSIFDCWLNVSLTKLRFKVLNIKVVKMPKVSIGQSATTEVKVFISITALSVMKQLFNTVIAIYICRDLMCLILQIMYDWLIKVSCSS